MRPAKDLLILFLFLSSQTPQVFKFLIGCTNDPILLSDFLILQCLRNLFNIMHHSLKIHHLILINE